MSTSLRRLPLGGFVVLTAVLAASAAAWACSPAAEINYVGSSRTEGPPGTRVVIEGRSFAEGPVEIRWNSAQGEVRGRTTGPSFTVTVSVPDHATPGIGQFVAVTMWNGERVTKTQNFNVTPATSKTSTDESGQPVTDGQADAREPAPSPAPAPAAGSRDAAPTPSRPQGTAEPQGFAQSPPADPQPALRSAPASGNPAAVVATDGRVVFGGSVASEAPQAAPVPAAQTVAEPAAVVGRRTATADLWSGFETGSGTARGLVELDRAVSADGTHSGLAAATLLMSSGLVALFAGFGIAELRRRRVLVARR